MISPAIWRIAALGMAPAKLIVSSRTSLGIAARNRNRRTWAQMQSAYKSTTATNMSHASPASVRKVEENSNNDEFGARCGSGHTRPVTQQSTSTISAPRRIIQVKRNHPPLTQPNNNGENGRSNHDRGCLNGYKYRLMTTPQLTNNSINLPETKETSPSSVAVKNTAPSHFFVAKEHHHLHQHQSNDIRDNSAAPTNIKAVLSPHWWQTIYQKSFGNTQTSDVKLTTRPTPEKCREWSPQPSIPESVNHYSFPEFMLDERPQHSMAEGEEQILDKVRVRSVQVASSIDVSMVLRKVFGEAVARDTLKTSSLQPVRYVFGRTHIIVQLSPLPSNDCPRSLSNLLPRYVVVYDFGSVVFFNLSTKEISGFLEHIKKHALDPIANGFERREHFEVAVSKDLENATGKVTADTAVVRELDMNTVGIISNIMGKTVALDWHNDTVDELLVKFSRVNQSVETTGGFTSIERNTLFQVVARNNSLFIDMIGKLGIKNRNETAWHLSQYEGLHEGMRKEFDLDERFQNVELKLAMIQKNAKFFLEVMSAQKSNTLEWVIIVLISFECVLMILDMSGWGTQLLSGFSIF